MITKLLNQVDVLAQNHLRAGMQPIKDCDVAYEAGRRIGTVAGISLVRQLIVDFHSKDSAQDNDL